MAGKIKLTPELLKSQSAEMMQLRSEYDNLFNGVSRLLNNTNSNWSDVLSNNFSGKIRTAQKSFSSILNMLEFGANAASNSATTFASVDSQLEKAITSGHIDDNTVDRIVGNISSVTQDEDKLFGPKNDYKDFIYKWFKNTIIGKSGILPGLLPMISPVTNLLVLGSGVIFGGTLIGGSIAKSASAGWLGAEFADGHPGVTAWLGKASASVQNKWGYAGINAYLGKAEAEAKADLGFMKKTIKKKKDKDGKWTEKETLDFINAEVKGGVTVSAIAADAKAGVGNDMLGTEINLEGSVGNATAEGKGEFSIGEDGIDVLASGKAMVSAVEGKASRTINILGIKITGEIGGYAGAAGVEGKVGIEDSEWVMEGGAAAVLGVKAGVKIGLNKEGWSNFVNFVDYVTFWD